MRTEIRSLFKFLIFGLFWVFLADKILIFALNKYFYLSVLHTVHDFLFFIISSIIFYNLTIREKNSQKKEKKQKSQIEHQQLKYEQRELQHVRDLSKWVAGATEYAVFILSTDGLVRSWNAGAARIHKFSSEQAIGQPIAAFFGTQQDWEPNVLLTIARDAGRASHTGWLTRHDGTRYWGQFLLETTKLEDESLGGFVAITRDLSDTRASERFSSVIESIQEGLIVINRDWQFVFINTEGQRLLRREETDLIGRGLWDEYPNLLGSEFGQACQDAMERNIAAVIEDPSAVTGSILENRIYPSPDGILIFYVDVTQKRRVTEELRLNEERLRLALQAGHHGMYDVNLRTNEATVNHEFAAMLGYVSANDEDFGSQERWLDRMHPDDRERVTASYQEYLAGDAPTYQTEYRQKMKDGRWKWIQATGLIVERDSSGKPIRMIGTRTDIQERKVYEEALRSSQQRYMKLLESVPVGVFETDAKGNDLYVNDRWCEISGLTSEQARVQSWKTAVHPDDRERVFVAWNQAVRDQKPYSQEYRFQRPNGKITWVYSIAQALLDENGHIINYLGSIIDLTERKKAELELESIKERLQAIFDASPTPIMVMNREGLVQDWNAAAEQVFGWQASEVIGQMLPTVPFGHEQAFTEHLEELFAGKPFHGVEIRPKRRDGSTLDALLFTAAIQTHDLSADFAVALYTDITELKRTQMRAERLNRLYSMQTETNAAIVRSKTPQELYEHICQIVVQTGGFSIAFVGLVDHTSQWIQAVANQGMPPEVLAKLKFGLDASIPEGQSALAQAIRNNAVVVVDQVQENSRLKLWTQQIKHIVINSIAAVPLRREGQVIGAIGLVSEQTSFVDAPILRLLEEMTADLGFALDTFALEERRHQTELALKQNEQSFRLLFDDHPLPMWVFDRQSLMFLEVNQAAIVKYGYSRQEFLSMNIVDIRPKSEFPKLQNYLESPRSGLLFSDNWQHLLRNGKIIDVEIAAREIVFANQEVVLVVATDITERKQAQSELEASRSSLAQAQQVAHVGSWSRELRTNQITWSDEAYRIYGVPLGTAITREVVRAYIDHDNFPEIPENIDDFISRQRHDSQEFLELEQQFVRSDGAVRELFTRMVVQFEGNVAVRLFGTVLDITERKQAQEALETSERLYRLITENAHDLIMVAVADGSFTYASPSVENILGYDQIEVLKLSPLEFMHPDDLERALTEQSSAIMGGGDHFNSTFRVRHKNNNYVWLETIGHLIRDPLTGDLLQVQITARDISERVYAQEKLEQSQADLNEAQRLGNIGSYSLDLRNFQVSCSDEIYRIFGIPFGTQITQELFIGAVVDDPELVRQMLEKTISDPESVQGDITYRIKHPDGSIRVVQQSSLVKKDQQGVPVRIFGTVLDITERQIAQEALEYSRELLNDAQSVAHVGSWSYDPAQDKLEASDEAYRIFGDQPGNHLDWEVFFNLIHPDDSERARQAIQAHQSNKQDLTIEFQVVRPDQSLRVVRSNSVVQSDANGATVRILGTLLDITETKANQQALQQLNAELEQRVEQRTRSLSELNAELESFTSSVSHDLRSPLNAVQGFGRALLQDYGNTLPSAGQHFLNRIIGAAGRMDVLINDLLQYSRLNRTELRLIPVSLESLLQETQDALEAEIAQHSAELIFEGEFPNVLAHQTILRQVLINLISNALKFVQPESSPMVKIWAQTQDQKVHLFIRDNGIGMDSADLERIFRPFERLHGSSEYPGSGIGLAFVKRGVERMGGQVGVVSALKQGSQFLIELSQSRGTQ